jgi:hypothetical protein
MSDRQHARGGAVLPRDAPLCPLCGAANGCVAAASASFDTPCWCVDVRFSDDVLARVPVAQRGRACVCRRCAEAGAIVGGEGGA